MKKVLLATTALVAFASTASADYTVSGSARFGLQYNSGTIVGEPKTRLEKRVTVNFDFATETDSGLELGGRVRLRSDERAMTGGTFTAGGTAAANANVYLRSGGFTLRVGNIHGAVDDAATMYDGTVGLNGNGFGNVVVNTFTGYESRGAGNNGVEAIYEAGGFKAHLSYNDLNDASATTDVLGLVLGYTFGDWTVEIGGQDTDAAAGLGDSAFIGVMGNIGDFHVGASYADNNNNDKFRVNAGYTMGATTLTAYVADEDAAADTLFGLGAAYDMGGATLVGGVSRTGAGDTLASAGIKFKF